MVEVFENVSLAERNSFGVQARARRLVEFADAGEIGEWLAANPDVLREQWAVLGGGNNVLFTSDFDGTLLHITDRRQTITAETEDAVYVTVAAGAVWDEVVEWSVARGLWGAENLSGIPSSVGAAPVQNIGAYGAEVCQVIESVDVLDIKTLKMTRLAALHCNFGYRDSIFKSVLRGRVIITSVNLRFSKVPVPKLDYGALRSEVERGGISGDGIPTPSIIRAAVLKIRASKLPDVAELGNAGSFFKNPVVEAETAEKIALAYPDVPIYEASEGRKKLSAGWLIEHSWWKGQRVGEVGIYERQALIIVNYGGASGAEIIAFARTVSDDVFARFGIRIIPEVNIW